MALDIRLDFITNIEASYIEQMTQIRKLFIQIDEVLKAFADEASEQKNQAAARAVALARTSNESACQSAIKTLCLLGERVPLPQSEAPDAA